MLDVGLFPHKREEKETKHKNQTKTLACRNVGTLEAGDIRLQEASKSLVNNTVAVIWGPSGVRVDAVQERDEKFVSILLLIASELL